MTQRGDQLVLVHRRASVDADLRGPVLELVHGPVLVVAGLAALATHLGARAVGCRVGDPCRLLLARPVLADLLVELLVLHAGAGIFLLRHDDRHPLRRIGLSVRSLKPVPTRPLATRGPPNGCESGCAHGCEPGWSSEERRSGKE